MWSIELVWRINLLAPSHRSDITTLSEFSPVREVSLQKQFSLAVETVCKAFMNDIYSQFLVLPFLTNKSYFMGTECLWGLVVIFSILPFPARLRHFQLHVNANKSFVGIISQWVTMLLIMCFIACRKSVKQIFRNVSSVWFLWGWVPKVVYYVIFKTLNILIKLFLPLNYQPLCHGSDIVGVKSTPILFPNHPVIRDQTWLFPSIPAIQRQWCPCQTHWLPAAQTCKKRLYP